MKASRNILFLSAIFLFAGLSGCKDNSDELLPKLEANYILTPDFGLTTTIFSFNVAEAMDLGDNDDPVFIRFDWDNDGEWDMMHSSLPEYEHRYFQPGLYHATMEVSRVSGDTDTIQRLIKIEQGYSPPQAILIVTPDSAHLLTEFVFDGSLTHDDEDSLETLLFRWDFNGDGNWDTEFQENSITKHKYQTEDSYTAIMEVKDTMDLIGRQETPVIVNLLNHLIKPRATVACEFFTVEELFTFDASESYEEGKPESSLLYSWDIYNDNAWEVQDSENPIYTDSITKEGSINVKLRVTAPDGLHMDTILQVKVHPENTPPYANLTVGCRVGNPLTQFYFHSRKSWDRDESMMNLRIRWDLDDDGEWDTDLNDQMNVYHQYNEPGQHIVRMAIIDSGDKESVDIDTIMVFEGNHETSFVIEKRDIVDEYYGTVRIGNQWWMQENFNSEFIAAGDYEIIKKCYRNNPDNCDKYGGLYSFSDMRRSDFCPKGWRVPNLKDFEILMENLEGDQIRSLLFGGSAEFHIQLAGYTDIFGKFMGLGENTHFWARDLSPTGVPMAWYFNPNRKINQRVYVGKSYEFYVRCIKK
ncbi:MAG: hypothetical protein KAH17_05490 [Bacteroidales bacterium]|nr:hypothetical protein [Bacteroidales bacterium]